jgi:class 3 adenylate cyclase
MQDYKQLVQSLDIGVAIVEHETWKIVFENAKFFQWIPPIEDTEAPLSLRIPTLKADRALERVEKGRTYKFEHEARNETRSIPLSIEIQSLPSSESGELLVQCHDISKQKESEYMLESYSKMVEKNTRELEREKERGEKLLLNIMPRSVYEEMKDFGTTTPQRFDNATILMLDFVGFTDMTISRDPTGLIAELNDMFTAFDRISELFGCERIKTIGDAYMAVSGLPEATPDHASNVAKVALRILRYLNKRNQAHPEPWRARIGINSGPVVGSMVGIQKYVYDIFGPGVNLAARMESNSEPMRITLTKDTYELIKDDFVCIPRGEVEIKGFGTQEVYFLEKELNHR